MNHSLSWTSDLGNGYVRKFNRDDVLDKLDWVLLNKGTVTIDIEFGVKSLQLRFENSYGLITLGEETDDDWVVTVLTHSTATGDVLILGDIWSLNDVTTDTYAIRKIFVDFYDQQHAN